MALSYVRGGTGVPLLAQTIGARFRECAGLFPEAYADAWRDVDRAARALIACGVQIGDRVGVWADQTVVAALATVRIGAIVVFAETPDELRRAGVTVLLHDGDAPLTCRETISLDRGWERFEAEGERVSSVELLAREFPLHPDDPAMIRGGAVYSHRALVNRAFLAGESVLDCFADRGLAVFGRVPPHIEVKIVDPQTGATVPRGVAGEQYTRGYHVMSGHWHERCEAIDECAWLHTGAWATMDREGVVHPARPRLREAA
jgi:acyl-CoA synthetase (AMP-forming)/AMP-acid ligase II